MIASINALHIEDSITIDWSIRMSKTPLKASTLIIVELCKANATLADLVKQQQTELDYQGFRIQGFLTYIKDHCKQKKPRATPTKSWKRIRKDLH